jgi:hypothetical protein
LWVALESLWAEGALGIKVTLWIKHIRNLRLDCL